MQKFSTPMLFTPGPVSVPPRVLAAGSRPMIHHRTPEFHDWLRHGRPCWSSPFWSLSFSNSALWINPAKGWKPAIPRLKPPVGNDMA